MSLQTPTTKEINDNLIAQLEASLNQTIPLLPKSFLRVIAKATAGVFSLLYKLGGFYFLQMFVISATDAETTANGKTFVPLTEWGRLIGVGDPVAATQAEMVIDINVEIQTGLLASNTQLLNSDNGITYITIGSVPLINPIVQATIRAASDQSGGNGAGAIGNLDTGDIVSFANPLPNVSRDATVVTQTVTGANAESTEAYRQRVVDRFQKRPQGGALADYEEWGEEVAGILNIYPYTSSCPGQVDVYVEATPESSGNPDGIPTNAQLQAVLDNINLDQNGLATRRPATALVNTFPITRKGYDVKVFDLVTANLPQVQSEITTALEEYFLSREPFISGLTVSPRLDRITDSELGGIVWSIVNADNGVFTELTVELNTIPSLIFLLGEGEKAKLASVQFL